ncbi:mitochondrial inner membrane protease subunit 1-like [Salvia hispanica]|uniref:mitochondrial inner membrane protease subunit 1-like n=1 Tax=Salvia hispanica TaxID=49212 RepID=UPI002009DB39|nr:mitochondrial inner membrane protease subunit 1-like [Salvia hispanica]
MERVASMAKAAVHKARSYCSPIKYFILMGASMRPTFDDFNIVLVEKISILRGKVDRGDIVIMVSPDQSTTFLTKRIKALGGDVVSYAPPNNLPRGYTDLNKTLVPNGHLWVEGDNLLNSRDSRHFGAVPYEHLRYRVFAVVWPPSECRLISNKIE